jgi:hypothetical protein
MIDKIVQFPEPPIDVVETYLALVDCGAEFEDPRLEELRQRMTNDELGRIVTQLREEAEAASRKARALKTLVRRKRIRR